MATSMGDLPPAGASLGSARPAAAGAPTDAPPFRSPLERSFATILLVSASATGFAMLVVQSLLGPPVTIPARDLASRAALFAVGLGSFAAYAGLLATAVALSMWTHRCCRNLASLGSRGHLSPAWAPASWLVPVVNLFLPWIVLRDLWTGSGAPGRGRLLVHGWEAAWLIAWAALIASIEAPERWATTAILVQESALVCAGVLLVAVVRVITRRQEARAMASTPGKK